MSFTQSFRTARWIRTINLVLQGLLFTTFCAGLNYLALHYSWRFDLTKLRKHSLSAETRSYIEQLDKPVRIVVTLVADAPEPGVPEAYRDISELLREYAYVAAANPNGPITVEYIDVYQRRREAEQLGIDVPNIVLVLSGNKRRVVSLNELYRVENQERKAFLGEQAFTAAILDVSSAERKKIYFLTGHSEMDLESVEPARGLSVFRDDLRARNFELGTLDLARAGKIPDDAELLVAAGPQTRYEPYEEELIRQYLTARAGRMLLLLAPGAANGLDNLLYDWGALGDDVIIYDLGPDGQNESGDLILRTFAAHPVMQTLINNQVPVRFGLSRSVRVNPSRADDPGLLVTRLIGTSASAWGERSYRQRRMPEFNTGVDMPGPVLGLAVASERVTAKANLPFSVRGGRMLTIGCADFVANNRIGALGNLTLALSGVNWLVDRDAQLNIPARPIEKFQLALSQQELSRLRYTLLFALPLVAAVLGLIVYWTRRS